MQNNSPKKNTQQRTYTTCTCQQRKNRSTSPTMLEQIMSLRGANILLQQSHPYIHHLAKDQKPTSSMFQFIELTHLPLSFLS